MVIHPTACGELPLSAASASTRNSIVQHEPRLIRANVLSFGDFWHADFGAIRLALPNPADPAKSRQKPLARIDKLPGAYWGNSRAAELTLHKRDCNPCHDHHRGNKHQGQHTSITSGN